MHLKQKTSLFLLLFCGAVSENYHLPNGKQLNIPNPKHYPYILKEESPSSLERLYVLSAEYPDAFLSCPKGYSILEMTQELTTNKNFSDVPHSGVAKRHKASLLENYGNRQQPVCPIVYDCLGFQACVFHFSEKFCLQGLFGTDIKALLLTIACFRDDFRSVATKFQKFNELVLYIYEKPLSTIEKFEFSHLELPEDVVFNSHCSDVGTATQNEGFFGKCLQSPPSTDVMSQHLWPLLGRSLLDDCRSKITQVYCAFQYDNQGLCLPPIFHQKKNKLERTFSFHALPEIGYRPTLVHYEKFLSKYDASLISARLAFTIMVNSISPQHLMEFIHSIYRSEFLYVIHINKQSTDIRSEITELIHSHFAVDNIFILPPERSFSTPHLSYESVRAQLEGFEELLRLGVWDFAINLSEDDILISSIDDLAIALAPHRGLSFLSSVWLMDAKNARVSSNQKETAFISCDGISHEICSKSVALNSEVQIFRASRGGVFSRKFVEYLVDEKIRPSLINKFQFHLQTDVNPDESYIPTILMNSPFKDSLHLAPILATKSVLQISDFDSGSNEINSEIQRTHHLKLLLLSHSSFFLKGVPFSSAPNIHLFAHDLVEGDYYRFLENYFPHQVLKVLVGKAITKYLFEASPSQKHLSLQSVLRIYVTPCLVPHDACCRSKLVTNYSEITDFNYWVDVSLFNRGTGQHGKARFMLKPSVGTRFCYNDGDLKMIFITAWTQYEGKYASDQPMLNFEKYLPLPYGPAFTNGILIKLTFSKEREDIGCISSHSGMSKGDPLLFKNKMHPIKLHLRLISPDRMRICVTNITLFWEDDAEILYKKQDTIMKNISVHCRKMEPGYWTLELIKMEPTKSKLYSFNIYLLDLQNANVMTSQLKEVAHLWNITGFVLGNKSDSFEDFMRQEMQKKDTSAPHTYLESEQRIGLISNSNSPSIKFHNRQKEMHLWFICSGGLATSITFCLTVTLFCVWRYRIGQNIVFIFLLYVTLVAMLQIMLYLVLCID